MPELPRQIFLEIQASLQEILKNPQKCKIYESLDLNPPLYGAEYAIRTAIALHEPRVVVRSIKITYPPYKAEVIIEWEPTELAYRKLLHYDGICTYDGTYFYNESF